MKIAIDLDNTIICYDGAFLPSAIKAGLDVPSGTASKMEIKRLAFEVGGNLLWTKIQAIAYTEEIAKCPGFPHFKSFLTRALNESVEMVIISHKSAAAYNGNSDLRSPATKWLKDQEINLPCYFAETRDEKIGRINVFEPDYVIDDLPAIGIHPNLKQTAGFILFDPNNDNSTWCGPTRAQTWKEVEEVCLS